MGERTVVVMMVEKLFHLLTGYAAFEVTGDAPRFLNLAARSGLEFWNFAREGEVCRARCRAKEYRRLRGLARRCRVKMRCIKKGGFPFLAWRASRRKGLLLGAACGAALYVFLSGFVWGVTVTGETSLGDKLLLDAAAQGGVYVGAPKESFTGKQAARRMISLLPELKWAVVNTDGCFAEIEVGEKTDVPEIADDRVWSNIVAVREGVILSVEAERGRPEVALGEAVEEGQLLISGLYQEILDPWDARADHPYKTFGAARGKVEAQTLREFTVQVSARKREQQTTGERQESCALCIFGLRLPLGLYTAPQGEGVAWETVRPLDALGVGLPVALEKRVFLPTEERVRELSEEELREAALLKLRECQKEELPPGSTVLSEELVYAFPDGMCVLTAKCRCREEIGKVQEILVKDTK